MQSPPASPSHSLVQRPPVAKHPSNVAVLKRQTSSSRNINKMGEKAANHDAMMKKFNLRKMSSTLPFPSKFGRASDVLIDKAIGAKVQKNRRFSLHRSIRTITNAKARRNILRTLTSPITPQSWASTCHGILILVVYHFQLIYLPFFSSYYPHGSFATTMTTIALEAVFLLDLLLHFNTAYVEHGVLIISRRKIARKYVQTWFIFDLFSAFPIQLTYYITTGRYSHYGARGVQITLIVLRLLRVAVLERGVLVNRVASRFTEWIRYSRYSHLLGIANLMWLVLLIAHYMACFWHVVSSKDDQQASHIMEMYVADYYYAVSLIQGQGNAGGTMNENLFSSVAIIGGSVILAIVFGNVAMLVSNFNANTTNYHRKMEAVYETMEKMDLPLRLRERVNEYYKHVWLEYESLDGNINQFQKELTHTLGIEVGLYKHMDLVVKVPFWKDCTPDFLTQIVLNLEIRVYMPDDYVMRRREIGNDMMMINRGYCKLTKPVSAKPEDDSMLHSFHPTDPIDEPSDYEGESSEEFGSEDERQEAFGSGMFGASLDSRRWSQPDVWNPNSDFTDIRRFQNGHGKRPSYPEGVEWKPKKLREYMRPGQAFGEMSLLMNYKRTANVRAITFVEMCVLSRKNFQSIISRYPEDRRRVLTSMLESCIERKVVPFPWESIIEAVMVKRRNIGKKNISRASVIATLTAKEAARILVEAIDINAPDESIKYGFQNCDQEFVEDSSLRRANSIDAKISDSLNRRRDSFRLERSSSSRRSLTEDQNSINETTDPISLSASDESAQTLKTLVALVQNMSNNIVQLQQEVRELKHRDFTGCNSSSKSVDNHSTAFPSRFSVGSADPGSLIIKEDHLARKPSFVAKPRPSVLIKKKSTGESIPLAVLRRIRSKIPDTPDDSHEAHPARDNVQTTSPRSEAVSVVRTEGSTPDDRYPVNLSGRSRATRNESLADMLWKRSNTSGDMLRHTEEERRLRRQIRSRRSMPSEIVSTKLDEGPPP
ncbi:hypothetical protein DVH05_010547 [Phytophthora capsici]|nr:hypothetical protein DVH05_010547 [Phytophthora capsici]